ncbi:MAG: HEAT repeat domain-containing protein [bacterium]
MNNRILPWIVVLVVALVLIVLLWPRGPVEPPQVVKTATPRPSPTTVPPLPSPPPSEATPLPEIPTLPAAPPSVAPSPGIDELDVIFAELAPAVLAKDKERILDILNRMAAYGDRAVPRLVQLLNNPVNEDVSEFAALGLAKIGTPMALGELLNAIRNQEDPRLKKNLRDILCRIKNPAVIDQAIEGLLQDDVDWWSEDAGRILSSMGTTAVITRLLDRSQNVNEESQKRISSTLKQITNPEAIPALGKAIESGVLPSLQEGACNALAAIGTPEATQVLLDAARNAKETDRLERILSACRWISNEYAVQILDKALDDMTSASVRAAAANGLANYENEPIEAHLNRAYERETDPRAKQAIAEAIQRLAARSM